MRHADRTYKRQSPEYGLPKIYAYLDLVHTFRFSTGWQVPIITGQNSGTQESIPLFAHPGR